MFSLSSKISHVERLNKMIWAILEEIQEIKNSSQKNNILKESEF